MRLKTTKNSVNVKSDNSTLLDKSNSTSERMRVPKYGNLAQEQINIDDEEKIK